jgi:SprT-like family protein
LKLSDLILDLFDPQPEPNGRRPGPAARPAPAPAAKPTPARPSVKPPRDPGARDEAAVLAALRRAGAEYRRVVFTQNRRIMISVGRDRTVIRMNRAFAAAPEHVLAAVAVLFSSARGRRKESARETVRGFIDALPVVPAAPRGPKRRRQHPLDRPHLDRLQAEFDRTNRLHFAGKLPRVPIFLSRQMRRRNGHFSSQPLEIVVSHRLCTHGAPGEAEHTLRHEMIHLWQYVSGAEVDHGGAFRRMAKKLDVHPRATRPVKWKGR